MSSPSNLALHRHHSNNSINQRDQDYSDSSFSDIVDPVDSTTTTTTTTSSSVTTNTGSLRKRSLPRSNPVSEETDLGQQNTDRLGQTNNKQHASFAFTTTAPFSASTPLQSTKESRPRPTTTTMFSSRQKYTALPNPNGTAGSSSGGKRRGGSSLSPMKKMIIVGGLVSLLLIGLMGGKHVTRSTVGEEDGLEGYEDGWTQDDLKEFESPPFLPDGELAGDESNPQEDGEEMFHILPVPHENGHKNSAAGDNVDEAADEKWSAGDIAELDGQEMDEPGLEQTEGEGEGEVEVDKAAEEEHDSEQGLTAPEEMTPSRGPDSFESDKDATSTEFCDEAHDECFVCCSNKNKQIYLRDMAASSAEEGQVISCHTTDQWKELLQKGNDSKKLMVIDFTASWCGPCRFIQPFLAELAKKLPNVIFLKVDVDELKSVATDWAIEAMPTFMLLKEGKIVDKVVGARKEELQATIYKHLGGPASA